MRLAPVALLLWIAQGQAPPAALQSLYDRLKSKLEDSASFYNTSFQVGFRNHQGSFAVAAGVQGALTGEAMTTETLVPLGSVTKPWTCVALLKAAESGEFSLDEPAHRYIDPVLQAQNDTTLLELWNGDATINAVTTRQLCHMASGVHDYDVAQNQWLQLYERAHDESPLEYLHYASKSFNCAPDTCYGYSSIGFVLAGFVLAGVQGVTSWQDVDQAAFLPAELQWRWASNMYFAKEGPCSDNPRVSHQWLPGMYDGSTSETAVYYDLWQHSCLNGWTMGNLATTAGVLADFFYELFDGKIINQTSVKQMRHFDRFSEGAWAAGLAYGLGLEKNWEGDEDWEWEGHGGEDYGSAAEMCGHNFKHNFSLCVVANSITGMSCSGPKTLAASTNSRSDTAVAIYAEVLGWLNGTPGQTPRTSPVRVGGRGRSDATRPQQGMEVLASKCPADQVDTYASWNISRACQSPDPATHYLATIRSPSLAQLRYYSDSTCSGAFEEYLISLNVCNAEAAAYYTDTTMWTVYRPQNAPALLLQERWYAGAVTGCEWHATYDKPWPAPTPTPTPSPTPSPRPTPSDLPPQVCQQCFMQGCPGLHDTHSQACSACVRSHQGACSSACAPYPLAKVSSWLCGTRLLV